MLRGVQPVKLWRLSALMCKSCGENTRAAHNPTWRELARRPRQAGAVGGKRGIHASAQVEVCEMDIKSLSRRVEWIKRTGVCYNDRHSPVVLQSNGSCPVCEEIEKASPAPMQQGTGICTRGIHASQRSSVQNQRSSRQAH